VAFSHTSPFKNDLTDTTILKQSDNAKRSWLRYVYNLIVAALLPIGPPTYGFFPQLELHMAYIGKDNHDITPQMI
jgi:hypothetical protein